LYLGLKLDLVPVRLVGISFESLVDAKGAPIQLRLGEPESGWRQATKAIDLATVRFGRGSVRPARLVRRADEDGENEDYEE
jgi:DNA polymerase-4